MHRAEFWRNIHIPKLNAWRLELYYENLGLYLLNLAGNGDIKCLNSNGYDFSKAVLKTKLNNVEIPKLISSADDAYIIDRSKTLCGIIESLKHILIYLRLCDTPHITDDVINSISKCIQLKYLNLSSFRVNDFSGSIIFKFTEDVINIMGLNLRELEVIKLTGSHKLTDLNADIISMNCLHLKVCHIKGSFLVTDLGLTKLLTMPNLEELDVNRYL
jgi:hypothetical protein